MTWSSSRPTSTACITVSKSTACFHRNAVWPVRHLNASAVSKTVVLLVPPEPEELQVRMENAVYLAMLDPRVNLDCRHPSRPSQLASANSVPLDVPEIPVRTDSRAMLDPKVNVVMEDVTVTQADPAQPAHSEPPDSPAHLVSPERADRPETTELAVSRDPMEKQDDVVRTVPVAHPVHLATQDLKDSPDVADLPATKDLLAKMDVPVNLVALVYLAHLERMLNTVLALLAVEQRCSVVTDL